MNLRYQFDYTDIDWNEIPRILKEAGMANYTPEIHKRAFENSHTVVFVFDDKKLIGFGRAISDGAYQAALYDIAILPEYQGEGIGRIVMDRIVEKLPQCNFILYAAPGKEGFYEKLDFRRMKTGMALFINWEQMRDKGFTE